MVKGITRQVIVVNSPDQKLFDQAIFIVRENAQDVTDEMLLKEAKKAVLMPRKRRHIWSYALFWSAAGAGSVGLVWLLTGLF